MAYMGDGTRTMLGCVECFAYEALEHLPLTIIRQGSCTADEVAYSTANNSRPVSYSFSKPARRRYKARGRTI